MHDGGASTRKGEAITREGEDEMDVEKRRRNHTVVKPSKRETSGERHGDQVSERANGISA